MLEGNPWRLVGFVYARNMFIMVLQPSTSLEQHGKTMQKPQPVVVAIGSCIEKMDPPTRHVSPWIIRWPKEPVRSREPSDWDDSQCPFSSTRVEPGMQRKDAKWEEDPTLCIDIQYIFTIVPYVSFGITRLCNLYACVHLITCPHTSWGTKIYR